MVAIGFHTAKEVRTKASAPNLKQAMKMRTFKTDAEIARLVPSNGLRREEFRDEETPGLMLRVSVATRSTPVRRRFSYAYRDKSGKQRRKAIGLYPQISLAAARLAAIRPPDTSVADNQKCATCRFFISTPLHSTGFGDCRRHAPVFAIVDRRPKTVWPAVNVGDLCGDYAPAIGLGEVAQ